MIRYYNSKSSKNKLGLKILLVDCKRNKQQRNNKSIRYARKNELHSAWQTNAGSKKMKKLSKRF